MLPPIGKGSAFVCDALLVKKNKIEHQSSEDFLLSWQHETKMAISRWVKCIDSYPYLVQS
jgi:hypothetical protein